MNEKQTSLSGQTGTSTIASGAGLTTSQTSATGSVAEAGKAIVQDAKHVATEVAGQAKQQVTSKIEDKKDKAAQGLSSVAAAVRQTGESLREHDQLGVTQYVDGVAEQIERLSDYVMTSNVGQIVEEAENFARREPVIFLGGAFLLGMVGARFLKASAPAPAYAGDYSSGEGSSYDYIKDEPRGAYGRGEGVSYGGSYAQREGVRTQPQYAATPTRDYRAGQPAERSRVSTGGTYGTGSGTSGTYGTGSGTSGTYGTGSGTSGSYGAGSGTSGSSYGSGTSTGGTYGTGSSGTSTGGTYGTGSASGSGLGASTPGVGGVSTGGTYGAPTTGTGAEVDLKSDLKTEIKPGTTLPGTGKITPDATVSPTGKGSGSTGKQ